MPRHPLILAIALLAAGCAIAPPTGPSAGLPAAPPGARKLGAQLPASIRHFALSNDGRQIAFTDGVAFGPPGRIQVAPVEGPARQVAEIGDDPDPPQWNSRGDALLFALSGRGILRLPTTGGEPETLVPGGAGMSFRAAEQAEVLVYAAVGADGGPSGLVAFDLARKVATPLVEGKAIEKFTLSPDGGTLAFTEQGPSPDFTLTLRIMSVADRKSRAIPSLRPEGFAWLDPDRLLVLEATYGEGSRSATLRTLNKAGEPLASVPLQHDPAALALGLGKALGAAISPGGKWILAAGKGEGSPVVSVETGRVFRSPSVGWRGWLDAETVVGVFEGGLYAMPLASAFDLTAPVGTGGAGK